MASSSGSGGVTGTQSDPTSPPSGSGGAKVTADGWDNEEWGSLEEPVRALEFQEAEAGLTSPSDAWSPDTVPIISPESDTTISSSVTNRRPQHGWEDTEFEPIDEDSSTGECC